jgi:hypothetical protein
LLRKEEGKKEKDKREEEKSEEDDDKEDKEEEKDDDDEDDEDDEEEVEEEEDEESDPTPEMVLFREVPPMGLLTEVKIAIGLYLTGVLLELLFRYVPRWLRGC